MVGVHLSVRGCVSVPLASMFHVFRVLDFANTICMHYSPILYMDLNVTCMTLVYMHDLGSNSQVT